MKKIAAIQILQKSGKKIFTVSDLKKLLETKKDNTLYKQAEGLARAGILRRLIKNIYLLESDYPNTFEIANSLYSPSYVSLASALNFYGILVQSPQQIASVTPNPPKEIEADGKSFKYLHLDKRYFSDYQKVDEFIIATPEKALIDSLFFAALGKGQLHFEELNLEDINKTRLKKLAGRIKNRAFQKLFDQHYDFKRTN